MKNGHRFSVAVDSLAEINTGGRGRPMAIPDDLRDTTKMYLHDFCNNRFGKLTIILQPSLPDTHYS